MTLYRHKLPKNGQNKRFGAIFCTFSHINRSKNQQTIQSDVFHQYFKLIIRFEIFLAVQWVIFSKKAQNWSKIGYLMEYSCKCGSQKILIQL